LHSEPPTMNPALAAKILRYEFPQGADLRPE
jgi:hypothetical protein